MVTVEKLIKLFIRSEKFDLIEFRTNNDTWPQNLRYSYISIDKLLKEIYINNNTQSILKQHVLKINQVIGALDHIKRVNNIEVITGHSLDRINGLNIIGTTADAKEIEVPAAIVLEIILDKYD